MNGLMKNNNAVIISFYLENTMKFIIEYIR